VKYGKHCYPWLGSLIWDKRPEFDQYLKPWAIDGPKLPIEFCRKSKTRSNALTLVLDRKLGTPIETLYAFSKRSDPQDAVCDLRSREGTILNKIGFVNLENGEEHGREKEFREVIKAWALSKNVHFVAWTDLESSFVEEDYDSFSSAAIKHLKSLDLMGIQEAVKYIVKAPPQIDTYLRKILMNDEWFKNQVVLYN
jgi:hypothetical protein